MVKIFPQQQQGFFGNVKFFVTCVYTGLVVGGILWAACTTVWYMVSGWLIWLYKIDDCKIWKIDPANALQAFIIKYHVHCYETSEDGTKEIIKGTKEIVKCMNEWLHLCKNKEKGGHDVE